MNTPSKKPVAYAPNKVLLAEIHKSKISFCSYLENDSSYHDYDLIIECPDIESLVITEEHILAAKQARIQSLKDKELKVEDIDTGSLVFRVMTFSHIPLSPKPLSKAASAKKAKDASFEFDGEVFEFEHDDFVATNNEELIHARVNFPPFQHFVINSSGKPMCVAKSHWKGDLTTGVFDPTKGQITNELARLMKLMCTNIGTKYNWRNYSYLDEMQATALVQLSYTGLRFNEARGNNPFAFYTSIIEHAFCGVLNQEKRQQSIRDDLFEINGMDPSWTRQNSPEE